MAGRTNELVKPLRSATNLQTGGVEKPTNRSPGELPKVHSEFISYRNWLVGRIDEPNHSIRASLPPPLMAQLLGSAPWAARFHITIQAARRLMCPVLCSTVRPARCRQTLFHRYAVGHFDLF